MIINFRTEAPRKSYSPIRILEWILCLICATTSTYILTNVTKINSIIASILFLVSVSFSFITAIDLYVTTLLKPMLWTTWILFASLASISFPLCGGLLLFRQNVFGFRFYIWAVSVNFITGCIFLLEVVHLIGWLMKSKVADVVQDGYRSKSSSIWTSPASKGSSSSFEEKLVNVEESKVSRRDAYIQTVNNDGDTFREILTRNKRVGADPTPKKVERKRGWHPTSHGGTFHVSKDVAPILNSRSPPHFSPKEIANLFTPTYSQRAQIHSNVAVKRSPAPSIAGGVVSTSVKIIAEPSKDGEKSSKSSLTEKDATQKYDDFQDDDFNHTVCSTPRSPPFYKRQIYEPNERVIGTVFIPSTILGMSQTLPTVEENELESLEEPRGEYNYFKTTNQRTFGNVPAIEFSNASLDSNEHSHEDNSTLNLANKSDDSKNTKTQDECTITTQDNAETSKYLLVQPKRKLSENYLEEETILPGTADWGDYR